MSATFTIVLLLAYFSPSIAGWWRRRDNPGPASRAAVALISMVNFFLGWTVVGWFAAWAMALSGRFDGFLERALLKRAGGGGSPVPSQPAGAPGWDPTRTPEKGSCTSCGGSGTQRCTTCGGRGSWYEQPQTATGIAHLVNCNYCMSSGSIRCMSCGGSGRSSY
jgi:hypothetical protein